MLRMCATFHQGWPRHGESCCCLFALLLHGMLPNESNRKSMALKMHMYAEMPPTVLPGVPRLRPKLYRVLGGHGRHMQDLRPRIRAGLPPWRHSVPARGHRVSRLQRAASSKLLPACLNEPLPTSFAGPLRVGGGAQVRNLQPSSSTTPRGPHYLDLIGPWVPRHPLAPFTALWKITNTGDK